LATKTPPAGGRATQAGMDFSAAVGVWFAAHLVAAMPVGRRVGLGVGAFPVQIQFETGTGLDDIEVGLSDGSTILIQCKTRPVLSNSADSGLASTIAQLVRFVVGNAANTSNIDPTRASAVLAVATDASSSLNDLESACRMFDAGGPWVDVYPRVNENQRDALDKLRKHANAEWLVRCNATLPDEDLVRLAKLFHIVRFDSSDDGGDMRESARIVGARLFGREEAGSAPLDSLAAIVRRLVRSGAPADRSGVLQLLRAAGHEDIGAPGFDADIVRLTERTQIEVARLERHSRLPIDGGVAIPRACMPALNSAAEQGSLLVIGEPGAGKTGVLVALAQAKLRAGLPTVFLSVDDLYGVTTLDGLKSAFDLDAPLLDVLRNWPGSRPGLLIVDALDASRGGPSESLFARFIEDALRILGERWSVLASIRTFDLRNGRRFRVAMAGSPPSLVYAETNLDDVRHFKIPRLSEGELADLTQRSAHLSELLGQAPLSLRKLLQNVFNLSIASELIEGGTSAASIGTIATQSELLEEYEDQRLTSIRLQMAVADSVKAMIDRRRLTVRKVDVRHEALEDALRTGVLVSSGDRLQFAHHVLFDHAAGRFYLAWDDADRLRAQVTEDPAIGLLLGPSLKFALERVWRDDSSGRPNTWALTLAIASAQGIDPVVASVALRTVAERVELPTDVLGLCALLRDTSKADVVGPALTRLSRFVSMSLADRGAVNPSISLSWADVAFEAAMAGHRRYVDAVRFLLFTLSERSDFADRALAARFGQAARQLLTVAWQLEPELPNLASHAIRMVTKSFDTDSAASRGLLSRILQEPRFTAHAHEEAPWLAEGVSAILKADADFAVEIYDVLFGRVAPAEGDSWMGGNVSRIMPLRSNKRQDYDHGRWHLQKALPGFLKAHPQSGTIAVNRAAIGMSADRRTRVRETETRQVVIGGDRVLHVVEDGLSLQQWRNCEERSGSRPGSEVLESYVQFLLECPPAGFEISVRAVMAETSAASIWARIFGIAAERPGVADDLLWPIATSEGMLELVDVVRDAVTFIAATFSHRSATEKAGFEAELLARVGSADEDERRVWQNRAARILSVLSEQSIEGSALQGLRSQLEQQGLLTGNRPYMTMDFSWGGSGDVTDSLLKGDGVNLDDGPDAELRRAVRPLDSMLRDAEGVKTSDAVRQLWTLTAAVVSAIDTLTAPTPHERVLHASWGSVSNAVEKIVQSEHYHEDVSGHPPQAALLEVLNRMADSPYPAERGPSKSSLMSWGNWDIRVYVASSYMRLAASSSSRAQSLRDSLTRMLGDPAPTVRLQVAQSLNMLWEVDRDHMWQLAAKIAAEEADAGVLGFFIGGPLMRLADVAPDRCEEFLAQVLAKLPQQEEEESRRGDFHESIASITARLWIVSERPAAQAWIVNWCRAIEDSDAYLWPLVSWLRGALFARFQENAADREQQIQNRAREVMRLVVDAAGDALTEAKPTLMNDSADGPDRTFAERKYKAGLRLMEHSCNQLYFGAGAFKNGNADREDRGLGDDAQKRDFLVEYEAILDRIALSGNAAVSYHLVELYEYLACAAPERVFDKIAELVVGPAASDGYHYESLALDTVARLVRRYLADYRVVFDDAERRSRLVSVLELFSDAGWPEALKLLYELPDLLR
jgi:hypothetical protein